MRFRRYPSVAQEVLLLGQCARARYVWNLGLEQRLMWARWKGPTPGFNAQAAQLAEARARPIEGLEEIARFWEVERNGADEQFTRSSDLVAVDADMAVVRVFVEYGPSGSTPWRNLWVLRFAPDGRCFWFEEWPFSPDQPDGH